MKALAPILVEISPGELLDKITVLEIKQQRIADSAKLRNISKELTVLERVRAASIEPAKVLAEVVGELRTANEALWEIIEEIYACEATADFGGRFIELARAVYRENDRRARAKRRINLLLGSALVEEKAHL